jgi:ABC-type glycerol-3-phosphate transport system permease component
MSKLNWNLKKCQFVEPVSATTGAFIVLLGKFSLAFVNSTLVAIAVAAFQIFTSALAGYALARLKFRVNKRCF